MLAKSTYPLLLILIVLLVGCSEQRAEPDSSRSPDAVVQAPASAPASSAAVEKQPDGSFRFFPISEPVEIGRAYDYTAYTHCGLDYAFDFDESFWDVVDRPDEDARFLEDPEDDGAVELVDDDVAIFTSQRGGEYRLERREGPKEVPDLCR